VSGAIHSGVWITLNQHPNIRQATPKTTNPARAQNREKVTAKSWHAQPAFRAKLFFKVTERASGKTRLGGKMSDNQKKDDGTNNRHDETGRMKKGAILGLGEYTADKPAHNGTANSKDRRHPKPHVPRTHDCIGDQTDHKTDEDRPNNV
jgi:hypothetical protein